MTAWQEGDIEANGIRLHYTRTGGAKPPVVLAHGFSDDSLCWTPVAQETSCAPSSPSGRHPVDAINSSQSGGAALRSALFQTRRKLRDRNEFELGEN